MHPSNFNSIKVRLKLYVMSAVLATMIFQFHKGTIKTDYLSVNTSLNNAFQFHKGTIKTEYGPTTLRPHYQFQFHKGTIKTAVDEVHGQLNGISIP